ncbi:MAG: F0F1 ATP synthase subunit B [Ruminococcus sp.]|nr:F0F1 ATP synthase subunit B [Ruminococcus sp.]
MNVTSQYFDFFSIEPSTVIGVLCNTLILFLLFKRFLFAPVNKIIEERKAQVSKTYEEADAALAAAKNKETEYTQRLLDARSEADERVREATKKAQLRSDEIIDAAKAEAAGLVEKANADIERERKRAVNRIKDEISDIAVTIAGKVINKELEGDEEQERLIDEFIGGLGDE